jgi:hypothetical protein
MDSSQIEFFEEQTKNYLQENLHHAPPVMNIDIVDVIVTQQKLVGVRRHLQTADLQPQLQTLMVTIQGVSSHSRERQQASTLHQTIVVF